jgi:hypothetical protein
VVASISQFHNGSNYNNTVNVDGLIQPSWCGFFEWIDDEERSPTPTPEDDDQYETGEINYEAEHQARRRHRGEDLIWCTNM